MSWARHRFPLALAAGLDAAGLVGIAVAVNGLRRSNLAEQQLLLLVLVLLYLSLGWLFGSYTLLKRSRLRWTQLLLRLGVTSAASLTAGALLGWLLRVPPDIGLLHRGSLIPLFSLVTIWSALVRLGLRQGERLSPLPAWQIVALPQEIEAITREWRRSSNNAPAPTILRFSPTLWATDGPSAAIALSTGVAAEANVQQFCQEVVGQGHPVLGLAALAEQELQRIPPHWVANQWLLFSSRIDGEHSTIQQQLKRFADVVISVLLLLITSPILALAALMIRAQDGGAVIYRQQRSGLLGQPFAVLKLRTMVPQAETGSALWATEQDHRITPIGQWLRRTRLDELPQLINVLRGEMSLIGPRPERPELEGQLEAEIPNYRLRHWVRPGLSGWAQVNMPYTSSVEDSELKLSYDLYYLRNAGLWLDLLILAKTIKIVLKAAGR
ncbi:exopolysaccharide biosynthesis polyprenyl glycosylphosphotransferase [Cyanobium sp. T1B-Tous]|uniref:exopolysaccharide biosynthesis polyprenyl glycosylphosphotransferase n=1 Tax=Cyanobium sp. T1B-Tous TaxID=2823721 RepID=UPI0020CFCD7A|nr:exopolysaccharide biosynthesis polyprenyl glycosylphosphotransferase [Cyanobium sp. T1B-Tous]MCP9805821.1 exopolysaccharide biosynthesis polyprenyl glycosylphosphotransferase [Cyanobium sp. T1B-Tous]